MSTPAVIEPASSEQACAEWTQAVTALAQQVRTWSEEAGWQMAERTHPLDQDSSATCGLPLWAIQLPDSLLFLEPVSINVAGAEGRVDLYAYPALTRVMLLRKDGGWRIRPELGPAWPKPWSRDTFVELAKLLADED